MASVLILVFAALALVHFSIMQWRAIWISAAYQEISPSLGAVTGVNQDGIGAHDFQSLLSLYDQFCPDQKSSTPWLREITGYYHMIAAIEWACRGIAPSLAAKVGHEMKSCSRYVAVMFDQQLTIDLDRRATVTSTLS